MKKINVFLMFVSLLFVGIIYAEFKKKYLENDEERDYRLVKKYLLNDRNLALENIPNSKLPIIWIHSKYDMNARNWLSFNSRNTKNLNQPYKQLMIKSVIDHCGCDFNVCLINDNSFIDLIEHWNIDINKISEPIKTNIRNLAFARILDNFGGLILPDSYLCLENIKDLYDKGVENNKLFVGELFSKNINKVENKLTTRTAYHPSPKFMGCNKDNDVIKCYINFLEYLISVDSTDENNFTGSIEKWLNDKIMQDKINVITAEYLGGRDANGKVVTIDNLMGNTFIEYTDLLQGIYLSDDDVLLRSKYSWFARLSVSQLLESNTILGKYMLLSSESSCNSIKVSLENACNSSKSSSDNSGISGNSVSI